MPSGYWLLHCMMRTEHSRGKTTAYRFNNSTIFLVYMIKQRFKVTRWEFWDPSKANWQPFEYIVSQSQTIKHESTACGIHETQHWHDTRWNCWRKHGWRFFGRRLFFFWSFCYFSKLCTRADHHTKIKTSAPAVFTALCPRLYREHSFSIPGINIKTHTCAHTALELIILPLSISSNVSTPKSYNLLKLPFITWKWSIHLDNCKNSDEDIWSIWMHVKSWLVCCDLPELHLSPSVCTRFSIQVQMCLARSQIC